MDIEEIKERLHDLRLEHKDLDDAINLMQLQPYKDELQMRRMKTKKLKLKEQIVYLESELIPDIEA